MKKLTILFWLLLAIACWEVCASVVGQVTIGERIVGPMASVFAAFAAVPLFIAAVVTTVVVLRGSKKRGWIVVIPLLIAVGFLPAINAEEKKAAAAREIGDMLAAKITGSAENSEKKVVGNLPTCLSGGKLNLNHYNAMYREYAYWLQCGREPIREIRVLRNAEVLYINSVFVPSAAHIDAFRDRVLLSIDLAAKG